MSTFIIEDGYNTSYIDTVFMALFYRATHLNEILTTLSPNPQFSYLQELLYTNFVENVRHNNSIDSSIMNEIRNYSYLCDWKKGCDITTLYNPIDYFDFFMKGIGFLGIKYEIIEISKNKKDNIVTNVSINYININVDENTNIKSLLKKWTTKLFNNPNTEKQCCKFIYLPILVPIYLNRLVKEDKLENFKIDINEKIKFENINNDTQLNAKWVIHSIICKSANNMYYAIISMPNKSWYIFSNTKIPAFTKIDITDDNIANKIKQECLIIFYRLDDNLLNF